MKVSDVYARIDWFFPFMSACDFDNVGVLVGDKNADVAKCVVALDCTMDVLSFAKSEGAQLVVTHHPVIFDPVKSVTAGSVPYEAARLGISVLCAHTNVDTGKGGINDTLCAALGAKPVKGLFIDGFWLKIGEFENPVSPRELALLCKEKIVPQVKFTEGKKPVKTVAFCSGSGGGFLAGVMASGADAFVTADVKHSAFIEAANAGFTLLDCGHFETEDIIVEPLCKILKDGLPDIEFITYHESVIKRI